MKRIKYEKPTEPVKSVDESYDERMEPLKSKHWYVRHCDWWCQRFTNAESGTYFSVVFTFLYVICLVCFFSWITDNMSWFWWSGLLFIIQPDEIYRHFRCKYLKKHHLSGPFGWGTLDKNPSYTYTVPLTKVLGLS